MIVDRFCNPLAVFDVATCVLECFPANETECLKLQKLVYYYQAWHLVWSNERLFPQNVEVWMNGPFVPELQQYHKGELRIAAGDIPGSSSRLSADESDSVEKVVDYYGDYSSYYITQLVHQETPWKVARRESDGRFRKGQVIDPNVIKAYYGSL